VHVKGEACIIEQRQKKAQSKRRRKPLPREAIGGKRLTPSCEQRQRHKTLRAELKENRGKDEKKTVSSP
jgi:hypothetical protein